MLTPPPTLPPRHHRLSAFISHLHRHPHTPIARSYSSSQPPPQTSRRLKTPPLEPAQTNAILRKLDGVDFDHHILTKGPNQTLLDACWAKVQVLLEEGVNVSHVKALLKQHPDLFFRTSHEQLASIIRLLNSMGLTGQEFGKVLFSCPRLLRRSTEIMESKVRFLESLGIDRKVFSASFANCPVLFDVSLGKLKERTQYLRDIGMSEDGLSKILRRYPQFFSFRVESKVRPLVTYLQRCGFEGDSLCKAIAQHSAIFGFGDLAQSERIRFLQQLGLKEDSRSIGRAFLTHSTFGLVHLQKRVDFLMCWGFSLNEIGGMVVLFPSILCCSNENLSKKMDYLVNVLKRDIKEVLHFPMFLGFNLEKRIIPRFNAVAEAKEQELHMIDDGLRSVVGFAEQKFQNRLSKILLSIGKGNDKKRDPAKAHNAVFSTAC